MSYKDLISGASEEFFESVDLRNVIERFPTITLCSALSAACSTWREYDDVEAQEQIDAIEKQLAALAQERQGLDFSVFAQALAGKEASEIASMLADREKRLAEIASEREKLQVEKSLLQERRKTEAVLAFVKACGGRPSTGRAATSDLTALAWSCKAYGSVWTIYGSPRSWLVWKDNKPVASSKDVDMGITSRTGFRKVIYVLAGKLAGYGKGTNALSKAHKDNMLGGIHAGGSAGVVDLSDVGPWAQGYTEFFAPPKSKDKTN